jgi:outer membrane lipoprotein SlyB
MITRPVWKALTTEERNQIEAGYEPRIVESEGFGMIIDVQSADQSTPGTNGGAALGSAIGSAAYIDRSLRGGNYSAGGNLALGLLGAAIGSGMDRAPTTRFQFRYTVKQGDGEVQYFDEFKSSSFRHSVGVCVLLPDLALISQQVCQQTVDSARLRYLENAAK